MILEYLMIHKGSYSRVESSSWRSRARASRSTRNISIHSSALMSASSCATSDECGSAPAAAAEMFANDVSEEDEAELTSDESPEEAADDRDGARWLPRALRMSSSYGEKYKYNKHNT